MATIMNAAVCYGFEKPLVIDRILIDEPRAHEVEVKMTACAICHSDILYMDGAWGGRLPTVYGHEAAGIVVSCGSNVTHVQQGDSVIISLLRSCGICFFCNRGLSNLCEYHFPTDQPRRLQGLNGIDIHRGLGTGCFAEFAVVHQSQVVKVPTDMKPSTASLLACGVITGYGSVVHTASVSPGDHVVVIGVGGVGINCIQAAAYCSAATVTAIDINEDRLISAKRFGATHAVNSQQDDPVDLILSLTDNRGADFVFVATGNPQASNRVFLMLRRGGKLILVGMPPVGADFKFEAVNFIDANQSILGCKMGACNLQSDIPELLNLYARGEFEIDELVSTEFSFENINDALDATRNGVGIRNVVVF